MKEVPANELRKYLGIRTVNYVRSKSAPALTDSTLVAGKVEPCYLRLRNEPHRCVIVQAGDRILPEMSETLALFAQKILQRRGVEIILNDRLRAATSEKAILQSGTEDPLQDADLHCAIGASANSSESRLP
jgi:thiamine monophosphate synthase